MNPTKRFFLILAGASLAIWIAGNIFMGPAGLSKAYRADHKLEHDRYLKIIKTANFKRYEQRPALNADLVPHEDLEFVEAYLASPAFVAEQKRITLYGYFFDFFNAALVVLIAVRFGRKPLLKLLDENIAELKEKMESAAQAGEEAEKRRKDAEELLAKLPEEERRIKEKSEARLAAELAALAEANQNNLEAMARELEDRKREEAQAAALLLKREIADAAIDQLAQRCKDTLSEAREAVLVERFASDLETQA